MRPASSPGAPRRLGLAFEVADLLGLVLDLLLGAAELIFLLSLELLLGALPAQRGVAGHVSGCLLRAAGDLVDEAHAITSFRAHLPATREHETETGAGAAFDRARNGARSAFRRESVGLVPEAGLEHERPARVIRLDRVIAEERDHLAPGQPLDDLERVVAKGALEDPAQAPDGGLLVLLLERLLRLRHRVVENRDDDPVLDVGAGAIRPSPGRLLEEGHHGPRDV